MIPPELLKEFELEAEQEKKLLDLIALGPYKVRLGNSGVENTKFALGIPSGFDLLEGLLHEMGHLIEIPEKRIFLPAYGMNNNHFAWKPALHRELRVFAHEINLCNYLKLDWPSKATVESSCNTVLSYSYQKSKIKNVNVYAWKHIGSYLNTFLEKDTLNEWKRKSQLIAERIRHL